MVNIKKGERFDMYSLIDRLALMGYSREEGVDEKSTFCVAGDIISIFPPHRDMPVRISFFDDEVESIKEFAPDTLMSIRELDEVHLMPDNDLLLSEKVIDDGLDRARRAIDRLPSEIAEKAYGIFNDICVSSVCTQQMQWLLPFVKESMCSIFDFLPNDSAVVFDDPGLAHEQLSLYVKEHCGRVRELAKTGDALKEHIKSIFDVDGVMEKLGGVQKVGFSFLTSTNPIFSPQEIINVSCHALSNYTVHYDALFNDLRAFDKSGYTTVICMGDESSAQSLRNNLMDEEVGCSVANDIDGRRAGIFILTREISKGFVYTKAKVAVIGREDISRVSRKKEKKAAQVFTMPKVGDYVVHEVHGIGRCLGTKFVTTGNLTNEYVVVEYKNKEILYVPTDKLDRLSGYNGSDREPRLSAIGGKEFERLKQSVKASIKQMAINLLELYSKRQNKVGYKYSDDDYLQKEFEDAFEHIPTDDQVKAVADIKSDMQRGVIMDRLLCGDVGYGKTEVALRAVYLCVLGGKQAALMCPGTVLSEQHFNTALERFKDFGVKVEKLNSFKTRKQQAETLKRLANGDIDFIIGTHRLLSDDVKFYDLGLLVLDEEQRFGVEHKEKIKNVKNNVDCLTMTATPIPRTLHLSLAGIRDISTINTPPSKRLPVQTYVVEETETLIRDACIRELSRGGQVFILYNRVETISSFAGRISEREALENSVFSFYRGEKNILVTTTIIENGIDLPNANTIIVIDSDRLGISQLYQLRGRVGRGARLAQAYFTFKPEKVLTSDAAERLKAIMQFRFQSRNAGFGDKRRGKRSRRGTARTYG